ncbi:hypothetical protein FA13DRAFT_1817260 [Coprinellus micaceus]|uniref:DUF6533 domain-containing protein n=1 Tax=Coprinellus micaceus TaxID=71717 RepID=A0A4Y7SVC5_COPMI|nr:hypothetical protein FA13DRAFT_1817260 [Coprinellus micaceus]
MVVTQEQIDALSAAVSTWRLQEYTHISFFALYIYYVLTTVDEEVRISVPQKWSRGKILFLVIRYGICIFIVLQLVRDYRNYFTLSPATCKALMIVYDVAFYSAALSCSATLGLCLCALLQVRRLYLLPIVFVCMGRTLVQAIFSLVADAQYPGARFFPKAHAPKCPPGLTPICPKLPAEPIGSLDEELGYPCYVPSPDIWATETVAGIGRDSRNYLNFAFTIVLFFLAVITLFVRYKGQKGPLIQVITRDGGLYYVALAATGVLSTVLNTPAVISVGDVEGHPAYILLNVASITAIPILAQRLMINMREVDYMGSRPLASTLLFANDGTSSEDSLEVGIPYSNALSPEPTGGSYRQNMGATADAASPA